MVGANKKVRSFELTRALFSGVPTRDTFKTLGFRENDTRWREPKDQTQFSLEVKWDTPVQSLAEPLDVLSNQI